MEDTPNDSRGDVTEKVRQHWAEAKKEIGDVRRGEDLKRQAIQETKNAFISKLQEEASRLEQEMESAHRSRMEIIEEFQMALDKAMAEGDREEAARLMKALGRLVRGAE